MSTKTLQVGWFSTGRGPGSRGLLQFIQRRIVKGELPTKIQFVFCNREQGEHEGSDQFIALVKSYHIPLVTFSSRRFARERSVPFSQCRHEYDGEAMRRLEGFAPDLCVMAGYMLIAGPELCKRYTMLNLHPALPGGPTGTWQEVIWALIEKRATQTGAMVHLATPEVDRGPVVSYFSMSLRGEPFDKLWRELDETDVARAKKEQGEEHPLFKLIRQEEYRREPYLLTETLRAIATGRIGIKDQMVWDFQGHEIQGLELTEQIGAVLERGV
jgi:folate-dependent phosphoribosylglycinamide formyltransferase PurN